MWRLAALERLKSFFLFDAAKVRRLFESTKYFLKKIAQKLKIGVFLQYFCQKGCGLAFLLALSA